MRKKMQGPDQRTLHFLYHALFVDHKRKFAAELFGSFAAEDHALEKDLEIIHHRADRFVELQRRLDDVVAHLHRALLDGEIDAVVFVECGRVFVAHARLAHVGLVGDDDRSSNSVDRIGVWLVVIADGSDHSSDVLRLHAHVIENAHRHQRARLRVVVAVDDVADVVHVASNARNLDVVLGILQLLEDLSSHRRHMRHMRKAVLSEAHSHERAIRLLNINADRFIVFYIFKFYFQTTISFLFVVLLS